MKGRTGIICRKGRWVLDKKPLGYNKYEYIIRYQYELERDGCTFIRGRTTSYKRGLERLNFVIEKYGTDLEKMLYL